MSFGPGYKQHTESLGTSYTTPGGINADVQHSQTNDNFGNKGHNLVWSVAYQGEKNSFMIGAHFPVYSSGAKTQTFNGAYSTKNNDGSNFQIRGQVQVSIGAHSSAHPSGAKPQAFNRAFATKNNDKSNFQIRGGIQDSSFGHSYKQRTRSLGGSYMYTPPGGINSFGNKMKSHTFRSELKINADTLSRGIIRGTKRKELKQVMSFQSTQCCCL